jgi:DNA-binding transcriptional LysR family regulator
MDLLQLEHFLAVAEERTFTRAAERVCRTQPAVSQSIKKLEDEIGAPLFARDVHEVSLTEAGRVLADYARRMVGLRDEAMRQMSELKALKAPALVRPAPSSVRRPDRAG